MFLQERINPSLSYKQEYFGELMLKPRKRITRKEIKEDPLVTRYLKIQKFYNKHSRIIQYGGIAILAILVIGILMTRSKRNAEITAASKLGVAENYYHAQEYSKAIDELIPIVETYPGTQSAGTSAFYVANAYYALKDYTNARKYYQICVDEYAQNELIGAASYAGVAACLETEDLFQEAAEYYEKAAKKYPKDFKAPFYLKDAGRCYIIAGNIEKGKELYQTIRNDYAESSVSEDVAYLLEVL